MSNSNQLQYFVSQSYRQVQLSVAKGETPYPYSEFSDQFNKLLAASNDEEYARHLTILLVEEAAHYKQTTDYLHQEMAFETEIVSSGDRAIAIALDKAGTDETVYQRRLNRHSQHTDQLATELA